ncbi:MAG: MATE family efflux transporter [Bradyrhizobium sp.]|uniref:MATE family efflux transporter n=1 Tax=Bradyrhizobium sp. TaxID=376 RepID=UPI0012124FDF|nr:MATE family efflux transporter [Bradyrhizobium sp.]THD62330.1 MAG: MATE family efflux transporter [Bradyrhizobium sp.]
MKLQQATVALSGGNIGDTRSEPAVAPAGVESAKQRTDTARTAILTGPILATLLGLAAPTVVVLLAQTAVNIAEAYYVGFLGTDALAGVAMVFPIFMLMTMMSNGGLGSGVASAVARAIGAGRKQDADAIVFHAVVLAIIFGAMFTLGTNRGGPALYRALGGQDGALDAALKYSNYLFAGAIPVWIVNLQAAALRGSGNVKVPAMVTLVGALVLIPTSPILIFGFGPVPRLGIGGAGIAFGVYYGAAMLVLLRYMTSGRGSLTFRLVPLRGRLFADILKVGIPTAVNALLTNLTVILVTGAVGLFGTKALAGYGIASRLDYVMIPILFGICTAVLTMVGVNIGAGQVARARRIAWTSSLVGLAVTGTIGLVVALFPALWLTLFSHDPDVLRQGATYLRIVAPAYAGLGLGFVIAFSAQGAGHVFWPFVAASTRLLLAAGGGWIAVSYFGGGMALLASMVAASLVAYAAICAVAMFRAFQPPS